MTSKTMVVLIALVATFPAQGILTYPDVLYYKFNEGSGSSVINWALPGGNLWQPAFAGGVAPLWDSVTPKYGTSAVNFAAITRLLTGYPPNLQTSFTIECWIRLNVVTPPGCTGTAGASPCQLQRLFGDYTLGLFRCYVGFYNAGVNYLGGGLAVANVSTGNVLDGQWHHIAMVHSQPVATVTTYIDGNVDQVVTYATVPTAPNASSNFNLGATGTATSITGAPFDGAVDEFRWWSEARDQTQIQAGMTGEFPETQVRAAFGTTRRRGPAHLLVPLRDFSVSPSGPVTSWLWDFGDGTQSTSQSPCHVYTTPGTYTVMLTVTDALGSSTMAVPNYVTVDAQQLTVQSCGLGDLYMAPPPPPANWLEGYTLISVATSGPPGLGWFFGIYPDSYTFQVLAYPPGPGNPFHFVNVGNPLLFPEAPLVFPPGSFGSLSGLVMDTVLVYLDGVGQLAGWTSVSRASF